MHILGDACANVTEMPRLVLVAGDTGFATGVPDDEAIAVGIGSEPFAGGGITETDIEVARTVADVDG